MVKPAPTRTIARLRTLAEVERQKDTRGRHKMATLLWGIVTLFVLLLSSVAAYQDTQDAHAEQSGAVTIYGRGTR